MPNVYWYGGSGNWNDGASHWSNNSGNIPASTHATPAATDDVVFDALSNADNYTVTVDTGTNVCQNFTMDKPTGVGKKVTWTGAMANSLTISGNIDLVGGTAGITSTYVGTITFNGVAGTKTIHSYGIVLYRITLNGGAIFQLSDNITAGTGPAAIYTLTSGTFNPQTYSVSLLGPSTNLIGNWNFYDLILNGPAAKTSLIKIVGNISISHTLTIAGNSAINRFLVFSSVIGTPCTIDITGTTGNSFSNVDFEI